MTTREVELKAVVDDLRARRTLVESAGATLVFAGRLEDTRYDTVDRKLAQRDFVARVRVYRNSEGVQGHLDWKGPTDNVEGYKVRDELTTPVGEPDALHAILRRLEYVVTREIDREIVQYDLHGTMIRFERYPRMDTLVEVEGSPEAIEAAIEVLGIAREEFTSSRLADYVLSYEARTGVRAAVCDRELAGDFRYSVRDA